MLRLCNRLEWVSSRHCVHLVQVGRGSVAGALKTAYGAFPSSSILPFQDEKCFRRNTLHLASSLAAVSLRIVVDRRNL